MVNSVIYVKGHANEILPIETDEDKINQTHKGEKILYRILHNKKIEAPMGYCRLSQPSPFYTCSMAGVSVSDKCYKNGKPDRELYFQDQLQLSYANKALVYQED